jgi:hypothetical protein
MLIDAERVAVGVPNKKSTASLKSAGGFVSKLFARFRA